jgi:hypothetical protein
MRSMRGRAACAALCALTAGALALPAGAPAAKVERTAEGGVLPASTGTAPRVGSEFLQTFTLKGKRVKGKQVLDVNLTLTASAGSADALGTATVTLIGPKGENVEINDPGGLSWVNLEFDDQSRLTACDPANQIHSDCNYLQGGTYSGPLHAELNPTFGGLNPKGTWTLQWIQDFGTGDPSSLIGPATLEVKTGKKFAKEDK